MPDLSRRTLLRAIPAYIAAAALGACRQHQSAESAPENSVRSIAEAIRTKRMSSEEVIRQHLARIEAVNPRLNAVVQLQAEQAVAAARAADQALTRGQHVGPLHGVPMTIKDSIDTAGVITTAGTKGRAHFVPTADATVVTRLKTAGAILLGKTNTPEFTLGIETDNLVYGRTNNPYDLNRMVGGSSGGPAAIVAAEGSAFDIGSDTGGSIRMPAHHCGVAGLKPTSCRVPRTGHIVSYGGGALDAFTQLGPIARHVDDLEFLLPTIMGTDWQDPAIVDMPLGRSAEIAVRGLRVAFFTHNGIDSVTPAIADTVRRVATALEGAGAHVREARPLQLADTMEVVIPVFLGDGGAWCRRMIEKAGTKELTDNVRGIASQDALPAGEFSAALERLDQYRSAVLGFMKEFDIILCPVESYAALPHGEALKRQAETYAYPFNMTGQPVAVVRAGTSDDGMPIGVQVVARHWREDVALAVARQIEREFDGWQRPNL